MLTYSYVAALLPLATLLATPVSGEDFSYNPNSEVGPDNWGSLAIADNQCGGDSNSPIDLYSRPCDVFADYEFTPGTCTYNDLGYSIIYNGEKTETPDPSVCEPATMKVPGVDGVFEFIQLHIHTNSEHTLDDQRYGAELHMVHALKDSDPLRLAVVGLFIQGVDVVDNDKFAVFLSAWDNAADTTSKSCNLTIPDHWWLANNRTSISTGDDSADVYGMIPEGSTFFNYDGGLTTPPCTEIVEWNVADKPLLISVSQYNDLASLTLNYVNDTTCEFATVASPSGSTSRPTQPLNNRTVERICPVGYNDQFVSSDNSGALMQVAPWAVSALTVAAMVAV
jgi:carbonic anhydrase